MSRESGDDVDRGTDSTVSNVGAGNEMSTDFLSDSPSWPEHLLPGALRFSHSSGNYDETVSFYRDVVGLPVLGEFTASFGEDGTIFGLPGHRVHVEIVRGRDGGPAAVDRLEQLVFYLSGAEAVAAATRRLRATDVPADPEPHPYWAARGAEVHLDPDGRRVVFAPWVFGEEPEPGEEPGLLPVEESE